MLNAWGEMIARALVFVSLSLLLACGGGRSNEAASPPNASAASEFGASSASKPVLELAEVKFESTGPQKGSGVLHSDGRLEMDGKNVLTLSPDGKAVDAAGNEITQIDADGKIGTKGIMIASDGTVSAPDGKTMLQLAPDGTISYDGKQAPIRVLVSDPKARRAAMFAVILLQSGGTVKTTGGPGCPMTRGGKAGGSPTGCNCENSKDGHTYALDCDETKAQCVCKTDGKETKTLPASKGICEDKTVWSKCGFPEIVEEAKPS